MLSIKGKHICEIKRQSVYAPLTLGNAMIILDYLGTSIKD